MNEKEIKTFKENEWLTRLALIIADKPQTLKWDLCGNNIVIISSLDEVMYKIKMLVALKEDIF